MRSGCAPGGAPEATNRDVKVQIGSGNREEIARITADAGNKDCGTQDDGKIAA
jgi:hypothetical protein